MKKPYSFIHLVLVAVFASTITLLVLVGAEKVFSVSPVFAQDAGLQNLILYAASGKDTDKVQHFIFFDKKTGDLWVYMDERFREHFRVTSMGQDLEEIK